MADKITMGPNGLNVPDNPIIPFIEGDGTGPDIWDASVRVFDAAVEKAYGGKRKIEWKEVLAGEKAFNARPATGCPTRRSTRSASTSSASRARSPRPSAAASARSTSRCARSSTCTSACGRSGSSRACPRPVKQPELTDMVIFRENTEDIYAGIEFQAGTDDCQEVPASCSRTPSPSATRRSASPTPPASASSRSRRRAPTRLVRAAHPVRHRQRSSRRDPGPQGQHHEVHRGRLPRLGLQVADERVRRHRARRRPVAVTRQDPPTSDGQATDHHQGRHRRRLPPADPHPPGRVRRRRHAEPQRRLHLRRAGRLRRRHRHRPGRQHQLRHRPRHLRGHPRHRAQVRRPGQGQPRLA